MKISEKYFQVKLLTMPYMAKGLQNVKVPENEMKWPQTTEYITTYLLATDKVLSSS